jgi:putative IMPACT (imprinted ancient) family translation regulator
MSTESSSLTPDERALAENLARIGPRAEPSPALDARVLAAARDAVAVPQRRQRRWPAVLGLAASLVLAVGLAWRLRPVPDAGPEAHVPTSAAPMSTESAARNDTAEQPMADTSGRIAGDHDTAVAPNADNLPPEAPAEAPRPSASDAAPAASLARSKVAADNSGPVRDAWLQRIRELVDDGDSPAREPACVRSSSAIRTTRCPRTCARSANDATRSPAPASHAIEVKHSRFLAQAAPVESPRRRARLPRRHRAHPDATHHCWAYRIGGDYRSSDDGEPAGTAGRPILAAIDGQGFDRVMVVVTRWYGGINLGAGGLVRAYGGAAAECLRTAPASAGRHGAAELHAGFDDIGAVHVALAAHGASAGRGLRRRWESPALSPARRSRRCAGGPNCATPRAIARASGTMAVAPTLRARTLRR